MIRLTHENYTKVNIKGSGLNLEMRENVYVRFFFRGICLMEGNFSEYYKYFASGHQGRRERHFQSD